MRRGRMSEKHASMVATPAVAAVAAVLAACTAEGARYLPGEVAAGPTTGIIYVYRPLGSVVTRGSPRHDRKTSATWP